jgi:hypothetical protein
MIPPFFQKRTIYFTRKAWNMVEFVDRFLKENPLLKGSIKNIEKKKRGFISLLAD